MSLQPIDTVAAVILIVTIVANAGIALADFASAKFVMNNSAEVGVSSAWLPMLGALKAAGAIGLLLGLLGVRPIGIAAAIGLVAFFIGAVVTHVRAGVFYNIVFPVTFLALAVASLVVLLGDDPSAAFRTAMPLGAWGLQRPWVVRIQYVASARCRATAPMAFW
jgi:hypothetical protein